MIDGTTVQLLVQAGAVGLCFYLIYVNRKLSNGQLKIMVDALNNNTHVLTKVGDKLDELVRR